MSIDHFMPFSKYGKHLYFELKTKDHLSGTFLIFAKEILDVLNLNVEKLIMKDARPKSFRTFRGIHLGLRINVPNKFYDKGFIIFVVYRTFLFERNDC